MLQASVGTFSWGLPPSSLPLFPPHTASLTLLPLSHSAISIKASLYCKLVRESAYRLEHGPTTTATPVARRTRRHRIPPPPDSRESGGSREFVMVWESHQFQWALKTELLVACPPPPYLDRTTLNGFTLLSIREPIASSSRSTGDS